MIGLRWVAAGVVAGALVLSHGWAYRHGLAVSDARHAAARAALQDDLSGVADKARQAAADLALLWQVQDQQVMEFENDAQNDPAAAGRVPDADSLQDLEALWRAARGAP